MTFTTRLWVPRSISLAAQLLLTFVGLVAGTTVVLTIVAYRSSIENLEAAARNSVQLAAQGREQALTQLLTLRQQRAEGFLVSVESICAEPDDIRGFGWSEECVQTMVREFRLSEGASGAALQFRDRLLSASGTRLAPVMPEPGALARVIRQADGSVDVLMRAARGDSVLTLQFDSSDMLPLFADRSGLGRTGEIFLADANGEFLTPPRHGPPGRTPPGVEVVEPLRLCRYGEGVVEGIDYRGVRTFHGFRPVPALGGACIDAHMTYDEALEPAEVQRREMTRQGVMFVMIGALLSLVAARRIAAPVRRLADSARSFHGGQFDRAIPVAGPSEVRALGRAFSAMAGDLAKLLAREQAARREAEAANRSKDQFLAMLSHELRTPLNAILGWSRLLSKGELDADRASRAVGAIERSAESQRRLIEDLLDISRIVAGRLRIVRTATRFGGVVEAALDAVRPQAEEKGVRLEGDIEDPDLVILADAQRLQQVVWNLVWNAVKFTPADGDVRVRLRRVDGEAELSVSDTGVGIAPELLPHVFEWFRQSDSAGEVVDAGLGLGLALVRQLVDLHGGSVRAESAGVGHGATFVVRLPLHGAHPAYGGGAERLEPPYAAQAPLKLVRVLIVDDDVESREVARTVLEEAGADVMAVRSAEEARGRISSWNPDVLISDIAMPYEDGYGLIRSLRASAVTLPAIALTSYARREDAERARAAGFQIHMPKPVDPERLVTAVASLSGDRVKS